MRKPKPPKHPRCHYTSSAHYALGIVSPSLVFAVHNEYTQKFWDDMHRYNLDMIRYKIYTRTCTKEEYKQLMRAERSDND